MATATVPTQASIGAFSTEIATAEAGKGNYDTRVANALVTFSTAAVVDLVAVEARATALETRATALESTVGLVRGVVTANVADLSAFTVAGNDGLTYAAGELVLLANQTTGAQSGPYVVGTVGGGTAALTRASWFAAASVVRGGYTVHCSEGTLFANTNWFISTTGAITIGTTAHAWYPERVTQSVALVAGTTTVTNVPVLSATKTGWALTRRVANTSTLTTGGYCVSTGGANGVTAGHVGTASVVIEATVAAGTINNADISTLQITVINR